MARTWRHTVSAPPTFSREAKPMTDGAAIAEALFKSAEKRVAIGPTVR